MSIGIHLRKSGNGLIGQPKTETYTESAEFAVQYIRQFGLSPCLQLFVYDTKSYKPSIKPEDVYRMAQLHVPICVHGSYVDVPWGEHKKTALWNMRGEAHIVEQMHATGLLVHLGNNSLDSIAEVVASINTFLWFEIGAALNHPFATPEGINELLARLPKNARVGICVDTAHIHADGVDISSYEKMADWIDAVECEKIMFHLNDDALEFGGGRDEHLPIFKGNIWKNYSEDGELAIENSGVFAVLRYADENESNVILERQPGDISEELALIQRYGFCRA